MKTMRQPTHTQLRTLSLSIRFDRVAEPRDLDLVQIGAMLIHRPLACQTTDGEVLTNSWSLPFANRSFDRISCEGVLEFVRDDVALRDEIARLLTPGGRLTLTVPNQSRLAGLDSLNLYRYLVDISRRGRKPAEIAEIGWRRRYSLADLRSLLADDFVIEHTETKRIGVSELINFGAMGMKSWLRDPWRRPSGLNGSLDLLRTVEDKIPTGDWGSILTIDAFRT
jgi:SAM-dependent methyltransferase